MKKKIIIFVLVVIVAIIIILMPKLDVSIEDNTIEVNEEYNLNYTVLYKGENVTDKVEIDSNVDNKTLGKYKVIFMYENKKATKYIKVTDTTSPNIELKGGSKIILSLEKEFKDPGYNVSDNYDTDISVKVFGSVDNNKEGTYELTYIAKDKSGNETEVKRTVVVSGVSPADMDIKDFSLNGYFEDTILAETEDAGEGYINKIIFAGDSVPLYYVMSKHINGSQLWHKEGLNAEAALIQSIYIAHQTTNFTFVDAFRKYQPQIVIMNLGMNSAGTMTPDYFIDCYEKLIKQIMDVSPNTKLVIQSIPPVDGSLDENDVGLTNKKINTLNYRIAEMCNKLDISFLNSAEVLKDENGQCKKRYCYLENNNYGVHQTKEGNDVVFEYIRTHAVK